MEKTTTYPKLIDQIIELLDDNKALNIVVLDVKGKCTFTDWMVFATGTSSRHVKAIAEHLEQSQKDLNSPAISSEGYQSCEWVLIDFFDSVVHVMQASTRDFYDLEKMWSVDVANCSNVY